MKIDIEHLLILKTDIETPAQRASVGLVLDAHPHIELWTLDQEDMDRVLRVQSVCLGYADVIALLNVLGFQAAELQ